jgi:hypothetical protein
MPFPAPAPPHPPAPPAPATRRLTREDIVRLGQAGRPWDFLPIARQALQIAPQDHAVRLLAAAGYAKLGLPTPAGELLDHLPEPLQGDPAFLSMRSALAALPSDRIPAPAIIETCLRNAEALGRRGVELRDEFDRWRQGLSGLEWFRTSDGNILRRRGAEWLGWGHLQAAADRFIAAHITQPRRGEGQFTIEGFCPPWIALRLARATPTSRTGQQTPILILQADPQEFLDGLAHADLTELIAQDRIHWFIGPDCTSRLADHLRGRFGSRIGGAYVPLAGVRREASPPAAKVLRDLDTEQSAEHDRLCAEVQGIYAPRDRAWWHARYAQAIAPGASDTLRVLVPTSRFSTFVQHSSRDLVEALRRRGFRAELLIEPDDQSQLSSLAYLRALRSLQPDLVILINCMRSFVGAWFPVLPFVCWIQDALPHQFDAKAAAARGPLDFLVGYLHPELFSHYGFSREGTLQTPVVTSQAKFHDGPIPPDVRRRLECEVAFVSHHAETPDQMHARLMAEAGDRSVQAALEALRPGVDRIAHDGMGPPQPPRLEELIRHTLPNLGIHPSPTAVTEYLRQYAIPLAERIFRHEALEWAATVCDRRGWRLRLFGRGWESHPRFRPYAAGPLDHGEELRAAYQAAAVNLHISITAMVHQRLAECALSGGLPLARLNSMALETALSAARRDCWLARKPDAFDPAQGLHGFRIAGDPALEALAAQLRALGRDPGEFLWSVQADLARLAQTGPTPLERRPDWLIGNLADQTFIAPADLEAKLARAISDPPWRAAVSQEMARRARERLTHEGFVSQVLSLVVSALG